tara:strand:- start:84 stop:1322 length:1239 start_codon:yes stop_codon:yes gene_type:complete
MGKTSSTRAFVLSRAYSPMVYAWSFDDSNIESFIAEIIVDGVRVSASSVQSDKNTTNDFTLNISDVCQDNLDFILNPINSSGVISNTDGVKIVRVKIYLVILNTITGLLETNYDPANNNNTSYDYYFDEINAYNWSSSMLNTFPHDWNQWNLNGVTKRFLNDTAYSKDIELNKDEFLGILYHTNITAKNFKVEILTYNSLNAVLNTDYIDINEWNTTNSSPLDRPLNSYIDLSIGTKNLINEGVSLTNVAYYTIQVINDDGKMSEIKRFNIVGSCDTDTRVHWVNKYGKQDSYTFKGNVIESKEYKSNNFQKATKLFSNSAGLSYSSDARGVTSIQNVYNQNFTVYSKSIGRDTRNFLLSLLDNNTAWVEIENNYYPIIIENGTKLVKDENNMPFQFVLNYSFANPSKGLKG